MIRLDRERMHLRYKLLPTPAQEEVLDHLRDLACNVYNEAILERIKAYEKGYTVTYNDQLERVVQEWFDYPDTIGYLSDSLIQCTLRRADESFYNFLRGESGLPKTKTATQFKVLVYLWGDSCRMNDSGFYVQRVGTIAVDGDSYVPEVSATWVVHIKRVWDDTDTDYEWRLSLHEKIEPTIEGLVGKR